MLTTKGSKEIETGDDKYMTNEASKRIQIPSYVNPNSQDMLRISHMSIQDGIGES